MAQRISLTREVSIPSSSGHQFTDFCKEDLQKTACDPFQSLLHQGISLLKPGKL